MILIDKTFIIHIFTILLIEHLLISTSMNLSDKVKCIAKNDFGTTKERRKQHLDKIRNKYAFHCCKKVYKIYTIYASLYMRLIEIINQIISKTLIKPLIIGLKYLRITITIKTPCLMFTGNMEVIINIQKFFQLLLELIVF